MGFTLEPRDPWNRSAVEGLSLIRDCLIKGEAAEAYRRTFRSTLPIATEIMSLIRADDTAEAVRRIDLFLRPKFASVADCEVALELSRRAA